MKFWGVLCGIFWSRCSESFFRRGVNAYWSSCASVSLVLWIWKQNSCVSHWGGISKPLNSFCLLIIKVIFHLSGSDFSIFSTEENWLGCCQHHFFFFFFFCYDFSGSYAFFLFYFSSTVSFFFLKACVMSSMHGRRKQSRPFCFPLNLPSGNLYLLILS